jgi:hypothetical protein
MRKVCRCDGNGDADVGRRKTKRNAMKRRVHLNSALEKNRSIKIFVAIKARFASRNYEITVTSVEGLERRKFLESEIPNPKSLINSLYKNRSCDTTGWRKDEAERESEDKRGNVRVRERLEGGRCAGREGNFFLISIFINFFFHAQSFIFHQP